MSCSIEQLGEINAARKARQAIATATFIAEGKTLVLTLATLNHQTKALQARCQDQFRSGKSALVEIEENVEVFLNIYVPAPRLVIIGAVHITQALAIMADLTDLEVTIIDPRSAFATPERFSGHRLLSCWPDEALPEIKLDAFTAVAALTHDPKIDDFALIEALNAGCFYVGALGSRKTHEKRLERLRKAHVNEDLLSAIHAPIGLNIGAASPEEIAVAILAEVITARRGPKQRAGS